MVISLKDFLAREVKPALGCTELSSRCRKALAGDLTDNQILFEVYDPIHEPAYLERDVDVDTDRRRDQRRRGEAVQRHDAARDDHS